MDIQIDHKDFKEEIRELKARLEEAEEALWAIRFGEGDALRAPRSDRERIFTLESAEKPYRTLVENMQEGAVILSEEGVILYCNRCFAQMLQVLHEKVVASVAGDYVAPGSAEQFAALLREGVHRSVRAEIAFQAAQGSLMVTQVTLSQIPAEVERRLCMVVTDLTAQKQAGEALSSSERRLEEAQGLAHVGNWEFDLSTGKIVWSKELFRLLGCDPALGEPDYLTNLTLYEPADAARLNICVERAVQTGVSYDLELRRASKKSEAPCWYHAIGNPIADSDGRIVRLVGTLQDITVRKQAENALQEANQRLRLATESGELGVWEYDTVTNALV